MNKIGAYCVAWQTVLAEQDLVTVKLTTFNLIYAMIAATIISLILIPYPLMALIVMLTVGQILFGVMGYVSLWGQSLNVTAMMALILAVGFSVDNAAHLCHSFMTAPLKTDGVTIFIRDGKTMEYTPTNERKARVLYALNAVGLPIIGGNMTTLLGMLPLASANSTVVMALFKVISLVMLFGMSHSIIYLPVVLSLIGPLGYRGTNDAEKELSAPTTSKAEDAKQPDAGHVTVNSTASTATNVSNHQLDEVIDAEGKTIEQVHD